MNVIQLTLNPDEKIAFAGDLHWDNHTPESRVDDIMETARRKLEDMLSKCKERNVKHLFFEGDIVNRLQISYEAMNLLGECLLAFKESGIELYTICGNHDILRNSMERIERSPIQTLFTFGVIKHLNSNTRVIINKKVMITSVDYTEYPPKADSSAEVNILLAHIFYNVSDLIADERHNLSNEDVRKLGYDAMFLGHDHEEHPMYQCDKTWIVRSGSIIRGTAHNYNFKRDPKFIVLNDLNNICEDTMEQVVLEHRPYEDVASSYVLNRKQMSSISGIQDVLSNLAEKLSESSAADGDRIWDIINTDPDLSSDCRAVLLKYISESV
jgi:DNA repair exonuclease SbcCD nuclease subunit